MPFWDAVEDERVMPWTLSRIRINQLIHSREEDIRRRAAVLFDEVAPSDLRKVIEKYRPALSMKGDLERGKEAFKLHCKVCHRVGEMGFEVGPDLLNLSSRWSKGFLLTDIIDPNANIAPGYEEYVIETKDGRTITGVIVEDGATAVILRRREDDQDTVLRHNIASLRATTVSTMPEGLEDEIGISQMADFTRIFTGRRTGTEVDRSPNLTSGFGSEKGIEMKRSGKAQKTKLNRNRRDFLKTSSLMGVTGFVSSGSTSTAGERSGETSRGGPAPFQATGIAIENKEFRLVVGEDGIAQSLVHKASGQECLLPGAQTPAFSVTQDRPYENELQLRYPAKRKTFPANSVRREGDRLIVNFELVDHEVVIRLRISDSYIGFTLETAKSDIHSGLRPKRATPLDEVIFLQLPVSNRTHFGEWLNVMWDDKVAVNLLATDPYPQIDSAPRDGYQILKAGAVREVQAAGSGGSPGSDENREPARPDCASRRRL